MAGVQVRRARPEDADRLTAIAQAAKRHWGYPEALLQLWSADLALTPAFVARHPTYAAVEGVEIVGFYALSRAGDRFELEHCWVEPRHMRCGVGAALFDHAISRVRSGGGSMLRIASDPNAEGFYRRMGARRVGEVPSKPEGRVLPLLVVQLGDPGSASTARPAAEWLPPPS